MDIETIKNYLIENGRVVMNAPVPFALAVLVVGVGIWIAVNWRYSGIIDNRDSEIRLVERQRDDYAKQVDDFQTRPILRPSDELATSAALVLHFFGDERMPTRVSFDNIWRWYILRTIAVTTEAGTGKKSQAEAFSNLFVTFEKPVAVGTLEVISPDAKLPLFEVKEFTNRYAIITFDAPLPAGTVQIRVY